MKKINLMVSFLVWSILLFRISSAQEVCVYLFYGATCPHCAQERPFLRELMKKYPIELHEFEVYFNKTNIKIWNEISSRYGSSPLGVPMTFIGNKAFVGFAYGDAEVFDPRYNAYVGYSEIIEKTIREYAEKGGVRCPAEIEPNISQEISSSPPLEIPISNPTSNNNSSNLYIGIFISILILLALLFVFTKIFKVKVKVRV